LRRGEREKRFYHGGTENTEEEWKSGMMEFRTDIGQQVTANCPLATAYSRLTPYAL